MMNNRSRENYQKEMDELLEEIRASGKKPRLLLHSCCAPCSSYVLEYLSPYFDIIDFYYNPNISPEKEYEHRVAELQRLIRDMLPGGSVRFVEGMYEPKRFMEISRGLEDAPEGGARCEKCFTLRLSEAARAAASYQCDYFATTLTISPLKNADLINGIGRKIERISGVKYLASDFKKKNGYKRSIELSHEYDLYRQNYCGCVFSKEAAGQRGAEAGTAGSVDDRTYKLNEAAAGGRDNATGGQEAEAGGQDNAAGGQDNATSGQEAAAGGQEKNEQRQCRGKD